MVGALLSRREGRREWGCARVTRGGCIWLVVKIIQSGEKRNSECNVMYLGGVGSVVKEIGECVYGVGDVHVEAVFGKCDVLVSVVVVQMDTVAVQEGI